MAVNEHTISIIHVTRTEGPLDRNGLYWTPYKNDHVVGRAPGFFASSADDQYVMLAL